jgi:subtilisin family serine protease
MDQIFDSQFIAMQAAFARNGIGIEIAYSPNGQASYMYQTGRLLVDARYPDIVGVIETALNDKVPPADKGEQPASPYLRVLSIDDLKNGSISVPDALDLIDAELGRRGGHGDQGDDDGKLDDGELDDAEDYEELARSGEYSPVTPVHVLHLAQNGSSASGRICPATEPEVPYCCCAPDKAGHDCPPCPPQATGNAGAGVLIGVCDTGLLEFGPYDPQPPWLGNVSSGTIDANGVIYYDPLGPPLIPVPPIPAGLYAIPRYTGHGTFVAGVASCMAPGADIQVFGDIVQGGGVLETTIVDKLMALLGAVPVPDVVNLSAGGYTRHDFMLLSFTVLRCGDVKLVAAAGNDATSRKFWPAAFKWVVGVGALGADRRDRAWFSNYGGWVDVYAPGEGLVNAYATGVYTYQEPPKRPARQIFRGMARWSGTSFSTPLVAGLIAAKMTSAQANAVEAAKLVLADAALPQNAIPGVGPALDHEHP